MNYNTFGLPGFLLHCHLRFFPHFCYLLKCNSDAINSVLIAYISFTGFWLSFFFELRSTASKSKSLYRPMHVLFLIETEVAFFFLSPQ